MTVESVSFPNDRGQRLAGRLHGSIGPAAVIAVHGMLSDKGGPKHQLLATTLAERGIPTLRFDFAGRGESEGRLFDLTYSGEMEDLQAAIEFLARRGVERLGLFGSSMGGAVSLLAAARDERVVALATMAAVAHPELVAERHPEYAADWDALGYIETEAGRIGRAFFDDARQHDVLSAVGVLRAPLLVLHGEADELVPSSDAHDIAITARHAAMEIVFGADHRFSNPVHLRPAIDRVADFLCDQLAV